MADGVQAAPAPFRWKMFMFVMAVMGAITTAAILLTLKAHPRRGTVLVPTPQPVSRLVLPPAHPLKFREGLLGTQSFETDKS